MTATTRRPRPSRDPESGIALAGALVLLLLTLTLGSSTMIQSVLELHSTTHYNTGNQAFHVAEAGVLHALNAVNEMGVVDFKSDVADRWGTVFGPSQKTVPSHSDLSYQVGVVIDATNPTDRGMIVSSGFAPRNARRTIRAVVEKSLTARGRGAIYLAADTVDSTFTGNAFDVNGNDHDQFGKLVPGGAVEAGIATRNDSVTSSVKNSLNTQQKDNVKGLGFSLNPLTPSIISTGGPSISDLDRIVTGIQARHPNIVYNGSASINGNVTFGTVASPQITYLTADDVNIKANGNASGAGILIVDGTIRISGSLSFVGWIIVRGETIIANDPQSTTVLGNATILGSLWTGDLVVKVGGSAIVDFCEFCLSLADKAGANGVGNIPKAMRVVSWQEVL